MAGLVRDLRTYKDPSTGTRSINAIDHERLLPRSGLDDQPFKNYYEALAKIGTPVSIANGILNEMDSDDANEEKLKKIKDGGVLIRKGKTAANMVYQLRLSDLEKNGLKSLKKRMGLPLRTSAITCKEIAVAGAPPPFETFEAAKIIAEHKENRPIIEANLAKVVDDWNNDPAREYHKRNHMQALASADTARSYCQC